MGHKDAEQSAFLWSPEEVGPKKLWPYFFNLIKAVVYIVPGSGSPYWKVIFFYILDWVALRFCILLKAAATEKKYEKHCCRPLEKIKNKQKWQRVSFPIPFNKMVLVAAPVWILLAIIMHIYIYMWIVQYICKDSLDSAVWFCCFLQMYWYRWFPRRPTTERIYHT